MHSHKQLILSINHLAEMGGMFFMIQQQFDAADPRYATAGNVSLILRETASLWANDIFRAFDMEKGGIAIKNETKDQASFYENTISALKNIPNLARSFSTAENYAVIQRAIDDLDPVKLTIIHYLQHKKQTIASLHRESPNNAILFRELGDLLEQD